MREGIKLAHKVWVDELDCSKSFCRCATDKSVEQVLQICLAHKDTHWTFIHRQYPTPHFELGGSTLCLPINYFLWIQVDKRDAELLIKKYKLKAPSWLSNISRSRTSVNTET